MKPLNAAQRLLITLGADDIRVVFGGHKRGRLAHHTKRGPGRFHRQGKPKEPVHGL